MLLEKFVKAKKIHPPEWLISNCHFLVTAGSHAYGCATNESDIDIFGFCTPKLNILFPHLDGHINNFGTPPQKFDRWNEAHIFDDDGREYDFNVLNIVNFVELCRKNNPDMIDVLFAPRDCIRHSTSTGELIRNNRHKFLSKQVFYRYRGYAMSQLNAAIKENPIGKRKELKEKYGVDVKFLSHLYRLILECEQILKEGDVDLRKNAEQIKYVRNGQVTLNDARIWFGEKEKVLEKLLQETKLPETPNEDEIKKLLLSALENHYGSLDKIIKIPTIADIKIEKIRRILEE